MQSQEDQRLVRILCPDCKGGPAVETAREIDDGLSDQTRMALDDDPLETGHEPEAGPDLEAEPENPDVVDEESEPGQESDADADSNPGEDSEPHAETLPFEFD